MTDNAILPHYVVPSDLDVIGRCQGILRELCHDRGRRALRVRHTIWGLDDKIRVSHLHRDTMNGQARSRSVYEQRPHPPFYSTQKDTAGLLSSLRLLHPELIVPASCCLVGL